MKNWSRTLRKGSYYLAVLVLVLTAAILANLVMEKLPASVTQQNMNSTGVLNLSAQTREFLDGLEQDVAVYWIVQGGQEDTYIGQLISRFMERTGRLTMEKVDPIQQPTFARQYTNKQVTQNSLIVVSGDRSEYVAYEDIYQYKMTNDAVQSAVFNGEQLLSSAMVKVTSDQQTVIYVLSGHGEPTIPEGIFSAMEAQNWQVMSLDLAAAGQVPEDCGCLLVTGVTMDLPVEEMQAVVNYLKNGGGLCLFSTYMDAETMPVWTSMLSEFGMGVVPGIVVEADSDRHMSGYPYWVLPSMYQHEVMEPLELSGLRVMIPLTQAVAISEELPTGVTCEPLLRTGNNAYSKAAGLNMQTTAKEDGDLNGPFTLGAAATRQMDGGEEGRIVWFPSAYILDDTIDAAVSGGNSNLLVGSIQWLSQTDGPTMASGKQLGGGKLLLTQTESGVLGVLIMVIVPIAILAWGVVVLQRRKRK